MDTRSAIDRPSRKKRLKRSFRNAGALLRARSNSEHVIALGSLIDSRFSTISLPLNEFPTSGFTSAAARLSTRLFSAVREKPAQSLAVKGQGHPYALHVVPVTYCKNWLAALDDFRNWLIRAAA